MITQVRQVSLVAAHCLTGLGCVGTVEIPSTPASAAATSRSCTSVGRVGVYCPPCGVKLAKTAELISVPALLAVRAGEFAFHSALRSVVVFSIAGVAETHLRCTCLC